MSSSLEALRARGRPIPMDAAARQAWAAQFNALPGMSVMGAALDLSDPLVVRVHLSEIRPHHQGGMGSAAVNGAVIAGLFDAALGVAGVIQFPGRRAGTVELSVKFLRPTRGSSVDAFAVTLKRAEGLAFMEGELWSESKLCAVATGMVSTARGVADD
ncbi:MAG: PaaI family thioesterase [Gammaproteobacteria bacterium]